MILSNLGQVPQSYRIPFRRPAAASFYTPRTPDAAMQTHLNPFQAVLPAMLPLAPRIPNFPRLMQPTGMTPGSREPLVARTPVPNPVAYGPGFSGSGFGRGISPYVTMRSGRWPGIMSSGANIQAGIRNAPAFIRQVSPAAFPGVNRPGGGILP